MTPDLPRYTEADLVRIREDWEREREYRELLVTVRAIGDAVEVLKVDRAQSVTRAELEEIIDARLHHHGVVSRKAFAGAWGRLAAAGGGLLVLLALWNAITSTLAALGRH